jgi:hypothetical protein
MIVEPGSRNPWVIAITVLSLALLLWAVRLWGSATPAKSAE